MYLYVAVAAGVLFLIALPRLRRIQWGNDPLCLVGELTIGKSIIPTVAFLAFKSLFSSLYKGRSNGIDYFLASVKRHPKKTALVYTKDGQEFSFEELDIKINQVANFLFDQGVRPGDVVALHLENSPEFIFAWFGCLKLGACAAFLNPNLTGSSLEHVINISGASCLITRSQSPLFQGLVEAVKNVNANDLTIMQLFYFDQVTQTSIMDVDFIQIEMGNSSKPDLALKDSAEPSDPAMLIYTSGTTGLPKAAVITHARFCVLLSAAEGISRFTVEDRLYCPMPLYHASAAVVGFGACMKAGATLILTPKFSARNSIPECVKYKATAFQYIGELCRYLLATDPSPMDKQHSIRIAVGNGMRPDVWMPFKQRFGIPVVCEFYASTEGTASLKNYQANDNYGVGAMGRVGFFQSLSTSLSIVKFDYIKEEPIRDANGHCIPCDYNEVGELIGLVRSGNPVFDFKGYKGNAEQTKKKILFNVFRKGDSWFRTGDLVRRDEFSYYYFVDRIGDTFRWKGENVSTIEVANVIGKFPGVIEANVYGVKVPHADGCAGMVAITGTCDMKQIVTFLKTSLPAYAVPLFIVLVKETTTTATMKQVKYHLRQNGFDPKHGDVYWLPPKADAYKKMTAEDFESINSGVIRL